MDFLEAAKQLIQGSGYKTPTYYTNQAYTQTSGGGGGAGGDGDPSTGFFSLGTDNRITTPTAPSLDVSGDVNPTAASTIGPQTSSTYTNIPSGPAPTAPTDTTGTAGTGEVAPVETGPTQEEILKQFMDSVNASYNELINYLGGQEASVRSQYPGIQQEINQSIDTGLGVAAGQKDLGQQYLGTAEQQAGVQKEDALAQATRLYNELQQGSRQRFGGASSAGEAYNELAKREFLRNQGGVQRTYAEAQQQIQLQKANLNQMYSNAVNQLELQRTQYMNQAQRDFQSKLDEIDSQRFQAGAAKESDISNAKLQALQDLRNQIYQINLASAQSQYQVDAQAKSLTSELESLATNLNQYTPETNYNTTPQTNLNIVDPTQPAPAPTYAGIIKKDEGTGLFGI